jgi:hypothetical protein
LGDDAYSGISSRPTTIRNPSARIDALVANAEPLARRQIEQWQ